MKYSDPQLQSLLAGEYVLGSLRGPAAKRFEQLLESEPGLREALVYWQNRLNPLAETMPPVTPPKRVWKTIQNRIHTNQHSVTRTSFWNNLGFWRGFALASFTLIVGYSLGNMQAHFYQSNFDSNEYLAVLQDQHENPMLVATVVEKGKALQLDMLADDNTGPEQVMQVWCMPKDGSKPVSIGIIDAKTKRFDMNIKEMQMLHEADEIAISIEPLGGSPMDEPTGEVMYRGTII
jgi:anti-sigma-K factor RskA